MEENKNSFFEIVDENPEKNEEGEVNRKEDDKNKEVRGESRGRRTKENRKQRETVENEEKGGFFKELFEWVKIIVVAAVAATLLNNFIIANSSIPTGSMENTIMTGSRVFGSRLKYTFGDVSRDDVAIFIYGYTCKEDGSTYRETEAGVCPNCGREDSKNKVIYYVKRVIGMPGDHIEIKRTGEVNAEDITKIPVSSSSGRVPIGTLYVNGEAKQELYLPEAMIVDGSQFPEVDVVVPEGKYYMLGDNRNNSMDARYWGEENFVSRDKMIAKVYFKYWPLNRMGMVE